MSEAFAKAWGEFQAAPHDETPCRQAFKAGWDALAELLGNEHYVTYTEDDFTVEHSLDCRLSGKMQEPCEFHHAAGLTFSVYSLAGRHLITGIDQNGYAELEAGPAPLT